MELHEYQDEIAKFARYPREHAIDYCLLGLNGEAGEIANKVKKIIRDADGVLLPEVREALCSEAGDVLWYIARLATEVDIDLTFFLPAVGGSPLNLLTQATLDLVRCCAAFDEEWLDEAYFSDVLNALEDVALNLDTNLYELADNNIAKLTGRMERGTLQGAGDER